MRILHALPEGADISMFLFSNIAENLLRNGLTTCIGQHINLLTMHFLEAGCI